jgi:hypothetical protein
MALLDKSGISNGNIVDASHVTNIYDALNENGSFDIQATGSFTGSFTGIFNGTATITASYAISASHEITTEIFSSTASLVDRADQPLITTFASPITASSTVNIGPHTLLLVLSALAQGTGSSATGDFSHARRKKHYRIRICKHMQKDWVAKAIGSYSHAEGTIYD